MKLIRWRKGDKIFPGIVLKSHYYDISHWAEDYNENFFKSGGLMRLKKFLDENKGSI